MYFPEIKRVEMSYMNIHAWNRKDATPEETIAKVEQILNELEIHTKFVAEYDYKDFWYSNRLEVEGVSFIGSNGKGITENYAKASAYGEFMERLQAGFLLNNLYPNKKTHNIIKYSLSKDKRWVEYVNCIEKKHTTDISDNLLNFLDGSDSCMFWDIKNQLELSIPHKYIDIICASSGLSAGNTFNEAFCQGLCEIFERYVVRCIYYGKYSNKEFRHIDESVYFHLRSYKMIEAIRQKGYTVHVVDCTLNNKLPVLGVFIMDCSKSKYFFKLASDINMDICLQRCITEVFQGCTFDLNFRLNMSTFDSGCEKTGKDFWDNIDNDYEYIKAIIDGTGKLSNRFIMQAMQPSTYSIRVFNNDNLTNEEAAQNLLKIALKLSDRILVANLTKFGFPALRIFIPYYSECFFLENRRLETIFTLFDNIKSAYKNETICDKAIFRDMIKLSNTHPYSYGFSLSKLFGVILSDTEMMEYIYDINLLIALLACYHNEEVVAKQYIKRFIKSGRLGSRRAFLDETTIAAICDNVIYSDFICYMNHFGLDNKEIKRIHKYYDIASNGFSDLSCNDCDHCSLKANCQYPIVRQMENSFKTHSSKSMEKDFTVFKNNLSDSIKGRSQ